LEMSLNRLKGGLSSANCARKIAGPLIVFIVKTSLGPTPPYREKSIL
jgi:hypothetical protein